MIRAALFFANVILLVLCCDVATAQDAARRLDPTVVARIESIVRQGIADGEMPGAVVVIADRERVLYEQAFGDRQIEPTRQPMTIDTVFDLASLTKPVATATSVMRLVGQRKLDVDQTVGTYLPEFAANGKEAITISDLLLHIGGLIPDNSLRDYQDGPEQAWQRICELKPVSARGEKFAYTDVGFIVLGKLVEQSKRKNARSIRRRPGFSSAGDERDDVQHQR